MRRTRSQEISHGAQTESILSSPFVPMFSGSKQRIFPLEDLPGTGHHPAEATAQSCCNFPAGKWIVAAPLVQDSIKQQ